MREGNYRNTYGPKRKDRYAVSDDQPNNTIAHQILDSPNKQSPPEGKNLGQSGGKKADTVTKILGDTQPSDLPLVVVQGALDDRGNAAEQVPDPGHGLHPHRRHKHQPSIAYQGIKTLLNSTHSTTVSIRFDGGGGGGGAAAGAAGGKVVWDLFGGLSRGRVMRKSLVFSLC